MALAVTLQQLRDRTRERANMENSLFVSVTELDVYINNSYCELYEHLIGEGQELFLTSAALPMVSGLDTYPLPSNFYKLRGVDVFSGGYTWDAEPFMFAERNRYKNVPGWYYGQPVSYRLQGDNIKFIPVPSGAVGSRIWYYPAPVKFASPTDAADFVAGWDEFVIVDAAIKCLQKEESDVSVFVQQKADLRARILANIAVRDAGHPERVTDVLSNQMRAERIGRSFR